MVISYDDCEPEDKSPLVNEPKSPLALPLQSTPTGSCLSPCPDMQTGMRQQLSQMPCTGRDVSKNSLPCVWDFSSPALIHHQLIPFQSATFPDCCCVNCCSPLYTCTHTCIFVSKPITYGCLYPLPQYKMCWMLDMQIGVRVRGWRNSHGHLPNAGDIAGIFLYSSQQGKRHLQDYFRGAHLQVPQTQSIAFPSFSTFMIPLPPITEEWFRSWWLMGRISK